MIYWQALTPKSGLTVIEFVSVVGKHSHPGSVRNIKLQVVKPLSLHYKMGMMKARRKKTPWSIGDVFTIALNNGKYAVGHVLSQRLPNTIRIALYDEVIETLEANDINSLCREADLISLIEVTKEQIDFGVWKVIGNKHTAIPARRHANEQYRNADPYLDGVGSNIKDAAVAEDFTNAFYALSPWNDAYDPEYYDKMLIDKSKKPEHLIYKKK